MKKREKLTGFEKRVKKRHQQQEEEYGRDEFLFGTEEPEEEIPDDEIADDGIAAADTDDRSEEGSKETGKPLIGNTTTMIADGIIAEQLSILAGEMEEETAGNYVEENKTTSVEADEDFEDDSVEDFEDYAEIEAYEEEEYFDEEDEDEDFYTGEIEQTGAIAQTGQKVPGETTDFDFYDMPEAAEAAAMAAIAAMAEKEEAEAFAEAKLRAKKRAAASGPERPAPKRSGKSHRAPEPEKNVRKKSSAKKSSGKQKEEKDPVGGIAGFLKDMSTSDRLIIITGICVLAVAIVSGTLFVNAQGIQKQVASFAEVGKNTEGIYVIGEEGLNASVSARADYAVVEEIPEEEVFEEEEEEEIIIEEKATAIVMKVASVQSDLKIKFSNKETGKLIPGIPFEVTVTSDSGKEYKWTDENKDGLIYHTEVPNGTYKIVMTPLEGAEYENYTMPSDVTGIKVTDKIEYKKVDVADEVKKESEINAAAEDTGKQDAVVESVLSDTVEWVESTKTLLSGSEDGFTKIDKESIVLSGACADPFRGDLYAEKSFSYVMPAYATQGEELTVTPLNAEDETSGENTETGGEEKQEEEKKPEEESEEKKEVIEDVKTDESVVSVTLSESSLSLEVGESVKINATVTRADGSEQGSVSWTTSDSDVASVSGGKVIANGSGSATITATSEDDTSMFAVCNVTVKDSDSEGGDSDKEKDKEKKDNSSDDKTPLRDSNGSQVYYKDPDTGAYVAATISDYDKYSDFYVKSDASAVYIYTGWQTIDGNTYFFDKNGNFVTGDQVIQGAKYHFNSDGHLSDGSGTMGIDVSKWNGNIDWNAVKNSGVSYVIIRCGYRGSSTGALIEDPKFRANISGAKSAGLLVGAYFYTQAISEVEAVEEASMAVGLCGGYGLNLPIFLDVEGSGGRGDGIGADMRTAVVKAFCQTVRNSGYSAGVYANKTWLNEKMHASQLTSYKIWLAQYAAAPTYQATRIDYWQYSSKGKVSGISGNVDMNIRY